MLIKDMIDHCVKGKIDEAYTVCILLVSMKRIIILQLMVNVLNADHVSFV